MSKNKKIALALICKNDDEEAKVLHRLLTTEAFSHHVDGIFITITSKKGQSEEGKVKQVAEAIKANISYFEWIDDFSAARNFNFSQVTEDYEFIIWTDADDIIKNVKYLDNLINKISDNVSGIILPYLYDFDEDGECLVRHNKIRIVRNDGSYKWVGRLHEDLVQQRQVTNLLNTEIQILHLTNAKRVDIAIERNLTITQKAIKEDPDDARNYWNHANALFMAGKFQEAINTFFKFIEVSGSEEEIFIAWDRISQIYYKLGDFARSLESGLEALRIRPWYPNAYFILAQTFFTIKKFQHAKELLLIGLKRKSPENQTVVWNPRDYDYNPLSLLAKIYYNLGEPQKSLVVLKKLCKMFPKKKQLNEWAGELQKVVDDLNKVDKICNKLVKCKSKEKIKKLLDSVKPELKSHPKLCHIRNIYFVNNESTGKDIAIYCFQTAEEWNPEIAQTKGIGGSEEAVIHMSQLLADKGWNVTVYNSCGYKARQFGKVLYRPFWEFNHRDKYDVLISWRTPLLFDHEVNAKQKYVWLHDTISENEFTLKRLNNIDKIFVLSEFHRKLYPNISDDKFIISANGVDISQFNNLKCPNCQNINITVNEKEYYCERCGYHNESDDIFQIIKRDPYRLVYTSAPERGIDTLLDIFPKIKKMVPEVTLALFYGWAVWDVTHSNDPKKLEWKEKVLGKIKQEGVVTPYERVNHQQIAEEYMKAGIFVYPTLFPEISCISVMKAQIAGCIPITTNFGALNETNKYGIKISSNDIYTRKKTQYQFINEVVNLLKNPEKQNKIRRNMMLLSRQQFSWKNVVDQWHDIFSKK